MMGSHGSDLGEDLYEYRVGYFNHTIDGHIA